MKIKNKKTIEWVIRLVLTDSNSFLEGGRRNNARRWICDVACGMNVFAPNILPLVKGKKNSQPYFHTYALLQDPLLYYYFCVLSQLIACLMSHVVVDLPHSATR